VLTNQTGPNVNAHFVLGDGLLKHRDGLAETVYLVICVLQLSRLALLHIIQFKHLGEAQPQFGGLLGEFFFKCLRPSVRAALNRI
jgi:hypothetical protein